MVAETMIALEQHEVVISVIPDQFGPWVLEVMLSRYLLLASMTGITDITPSPSQCWDRRAFIQSKHSEQWLCP